MSLIFRAEEYKKIDVDYILNNYNQLDVWRWILGFYVNIGEKFTNPFRLNDKHPGAFLSIHNGIIFLIDFASPEYNYWTIFKAVRYKYKLNLKEACEKIDKELKPNFKKVIFKEKENEFEFIINPIYRNFNVNDKEYWQKREISKQNLIEDNTRAVKAYYINSRKYPDKFAYVIPSSLCYSIGNFESGNIKLYMPLIKKFLTNCNANDIGGWNTQNKNENYIIITKGYKDWRHLKNIGYNSIWLQSETTKLSNEHKKFLKNNYENIYVLYDLDETGIIYSKLLDESFIPLYFPDWFYEKNLVDGDDYVVKYGINSYKKLINNILI